MYCSPVLISVLDRASHFKNCVDSLAKNTLAKETHLFIALDAPFSEKHKAGYGKVLSYINEIEGFKEVTLFKREKNMGSTANQFLAIEDIFKYYDRLIFTEDDNVFSKIFLDFINQGLELFKDRPDIISVAGHNYLIDIPKTYQSNYYIWPGFDAWGMGLWKEKWNKIDFSTNYNKTNPLTIKKIIELNSIAGHYVQALFKMAETGVLQNDFAMCLHLIENDMFSLFPTISKVRNNGSDGSGENSGISGIYANQTIDVAETIHLEIDEGSHPDYEIFLTLKRFFRLKNKSKIKLLIKYIKLIIFPKKQNSIGISSRN